MASCEEVRQFLLVHLEQDSLAHERGEFDAEPGTLTVALIAALQGGLLAQTAQSVRPLELALDLALDGVATHFTPSMDRD